MLGKDNPELANGGNNNPPSTICSHLEVGLTWMEYYANRFQVWTIQLFVFQDPFVLIGIDIIEQKDLGRLLYS